jgi:hypothetical protein
VLEARATDGRPDAIETAGFVSGGIGERGKVRDAVSTTVVGAGKGCSCATREAGGVCGARAVSAGATTAGCGPSVSRWKGDLRQPFDTARTIAQASTALRRVQRACDIGRPLDFETLSSTPAS